MVTLNGNIHHTDDNDDDDYFWIHCYCSNLGHHLLSPGPLHQPPH